MEYEYRAIRLAANSPFSQENTDQLNELFSQGWEYVHGFSQSVSMTSSSYHDKEGAILIILRRKEEIKL